MKRITWIFLCFLLLLQVAYPQQQGPLGGITLEDLWLRYRYIPQFPNQFRWMQDDHYYSTLEKEDGPAIWKNDIEREEKVEKILDLTGIAFPEGLNSQSIQEYEFNADESKILLKAQVQSIYRHSSREITMVYDRASKTLKPIKEGEKISLATFSPDANKIAFTYQNNLYYQDLATGKEIAVTTDGVINEVINGSTDWVNEEEMSFVKAFAWSPDNRYLAFYRFDESDVKEFAMTMYRDLYPEEYRFKYPKAGEKNAVVTIHVYDLQTGKTVTADIGSETDQYIARMTWTPGDQQLALMRFNRLQNEVDVLLVNPEDGSANVILEEKNDTYIELSPGPGLGDGKIEKWYFLKNSPDFLWTSEQNGYNHVYRYSREGTLVKQITQGDWEVTEVSALDEANETLYFISTEVSPLERHLYSIGLDGKGKKSLTKEEGTHEVSFSSACNFFVDTYSTTIQPPRTVLRKANGKEVKVLVDNTPLQSQIEKLGLKQPEFFTLETSEAITLNGWMIKPPNFDPNTQYPVLMFCYGGPASQTVMNSWGLEEGDPGFNYMWHQMLAQEGYIVVSVDNRGTGARGEAFKKSIYADLGRLETIDQIESAKWLQKQTYVDPDRIGIWGWSYGGYLTSLCMVKGNGLFKAGIAVAPVTNWRFYDTIYTERYLKRPQDNPDGYDDNSPINFAKGLKGSFLLVHGTGDDNVHFQNSMEFVDALVNANKEFDSFFYPNKNHGIYGGYTRYHLFRKMTNFVKEKL